MEAEHEDEDKPSVDEHGSFVRVLQSVLKVVKSHFQALCTALVKYLHFEQLGNLTNHIECMETLVDGRTTILRNDAHRIVTELVRFFGADVNSICQFTKMAGASLNTELADAVVDSQGW